jgi:hypothetical protein
VHALNADDELGRAKVVSFETGPSARTLREAARDRARSARVGARRLRVVTHCPSGGGHCQVLVELRKRGRLLGRVRLQQTPDTFHLHRIEPSDRRTQRLIRRGRDPGMDVVVKMGHGVAGDRALGGSRQAQARARAKP